MACESKWSIPLTSQASLGGDISTHIVEVSPKSFIDLNSASYGAEDASSLHPIGRTRRLGNMILPKVNGV
jgi:hypothetical protein